jgi:hypothetical protein
MHFIRSNCAPKRQGLVATPEPCSFIGEVVYQMKEFTNYFISSASEEPSEGWPYENVFSRLSSSGASKEVVQGIVDDYVNSYLPVVGTQYADQPVTISAINTNGIAPFLIVFKDLIDMLIKVLREEKYKYYYIISKAKNNSQTFKLTSYVDILSFVSNIQTLLQDSNSELDVNIRRLIDVVYKSHNEFIYKKSLDSEIEEHKLQQHGGVTIYFPPRMYEEDHVLSKAYMLMDFSRDFPSWWQFIEVFYTE